ncbi:hypothetical protein AHAS_Ahas19G0162700 [Arachis hypogaea]
MAASDLFSADVPPIQVPREEVGNDLNHLLVRLQIQILEFILHFDLNYHCSLLLPLLVALAIAIVTVDVQASFAMDGTLLLASLSIAKALLEVGMATNIPPHNLGELVDVLCMLIHKPEATLQELLEYMPRPDFPIGGLIMGNLGILVA